MLKQPRDNVILTHPSGQNRQKKNSQKGAFLLILHSKYSVVLSKIHSYRLLLAILPTGKRKFTGSGKPIPLSKSPYLSGIPLIN